MIGLFVIIQIKVLRIFYPHSSHVKSVTIARLCVYSIVLNETLQYHYTALFKFSILLPLFLYTYAFLLQKHYHSLW